MTIQADPSEKAYAGDGVSTVFAIPFPFDTAADLKLTSTDTSGNILTLSSGFTISGGAGSTGNATFAVAPASGITITIYDDPARTQPTDYVSLDAFPAESHERALDRVTRIAKRLYQLVQRSVRFPDGDASTNAVLGSVANRKGKYLFFNTVTGAIEYAANIVTTTLSQSIIGQLLNPQTNAEIAAGITPNYAYVSGNMLRYAADPTGVTDSTPAWLLALAQRKLGGAKIVFPPGLYKGNFVVTGQNIVIEIEEPFYEDTNTVGFIANNTALPVWSIGDGATLTSSIMFRGGLKMHGQGTAQKGILFNGVQNCWMDSLISRGFTTYSVSYTASLTRPTSYVWINNYRIDAWGGAAAAIGLVMTQPANYPTSYATAFYLNGGAIQSPAGTLWGVQINANCTLQVSNSYWTMGHNIGINFSDAGGTGQIVCDNLSIDTLGTSNDVLVTSASNTPLASNMYGKFTLNGKVSINGLVSAVALTGTPVYLGNRTMLLFPSVTGTIDFQDSAANKADQQAQASQPISLSRSGNNWFIKNTVGAALCQATSLNLTNAAGNADAPLVFGVTLIKAFTGAGAPAVAAPVGSLYLRSDGGAGTSLYVKESGTGTSGWVAK